MKKIQPDKIPRITKNLKKLEKELNIKIKHEGKEIIIEGNPEEEYVAEKVIDALSFGFPFSIALSLKEESIFEIINIKEHARTKDLPRIRARIIGKKGRALKTLTSLTNCNFEVKDNKVGIIGEPEFIENATEAIIFLTKGTKHGNVYAFLEKHQIQPIEDLGLIEKKKRKKKRPE